MRSSLRKTNYSGTNSGRGWGNSGGGSGGGTPTNPTPPDSMHSEDSSYVSAKETSSSQHSSGVSALRVRFSPVTASFDGGGGGTLMDIPVQGQSQDFTVPLKVRFLSFYLLFKLSNVIYFD